jgi:hypothetical protein
MTYQLLYRYPLIVCALFLCTRLPVSGQEMDKVQREIVLRNHAVMVEDSMKIHDYYAIRDQVTEKLLTALSSGSTNFSDEIKALVSDEDLSVQSCSASLSNAVLEVKIVSRVVFNSFDRPAKIKWLCFFGAQKLTFANGSMGRNGNGLEIQIFNMAETPIVWFPSLGEAPEHELKNIEQYKRMVELTSGRPDIQFDLRLKRATNAERLFSWRPGKKLPENPASEALLQLSKSHPLTENDLQSLVSDMQFAKPGYYLFREFE